MAFEQDFRSLVNGELRYAKDFLIALHDKGETIEEITTAARILRESSIKVEIDQSDGYLLDMVGTGGDNSSSFNFSTAASLIVAATGRKVGKHFNKAVTSPVGSADFLGALEIKYDLKPEQNQKLFKKTNICLMYAPSYHPVMKNVADIREQISLENKHRTIFNLVGPLANPANAKTYLTGACSLDIAEILANSFNCLGVIKALVVHGENGLDEISLGKTFIYAVEDGEVSGKQFWLRGYESEGSIEYLKVNSAEESAAIFKKIISKEDLSDKEEIIKKILILNAGAGVYANCTDGRILDILDGIAEAKRAINNGSAKNKLEDVVEVSNSC